MNLSNDSPHPGLLRRGDCAILVVDVQEAFRWHIEGFESMVSEIRLLTAAADLLGIPIAWSEQYPAGLGHTVAELPRDAARTFEKLTLSAFATPAWGELPAEVRDATQFVVVGIESHVCIRHTVLGMLAAGRDVHVPVDAVGSSSLLRHDAAIAAMEQAGAQRATVEQVLFDLLGVAGTPEFTSVQRLLKAHAAAG